MSRPSLRRRPVAPRRVTVGLAAAVAGLIGLVPANAAAGWAASAAGGARSAAAGGGGTAVGAAKAESRTVTLVGSVQDELGCSADWQPTCEATTLDQDGSGTSYRKTFSVPAGSYEIKVAINGSWDENYGVGGAKDGANYPLVLAGPAKLVISYDDATHQLGIAPETLSGPASAADSSLAKDSLRAPLTQERFYFAMGDRFANDDPTNDRGGLTGDRLATGYDPSNKGFFHGGDLAGLKGKLDYIKSLGTTAIWLTPSFKNRPVQGSGADASAGYHGYWVTDFTQIDPHLGTNAEMKQLIDAAHAKGMKVFFDIITNHTADVIDSGAAGPHCAAAATAPAYAYIAKADCLYVDASGKAFDDHDFARGDTFPAVDAATSFPRVPTFRSEADKTLKVPAWLNDPTMYHNRGDSTYQGESTTYGDFSGLDDLWTERPEVVKGMTDIYASWAKFGIDGFRIDTMKHVNLDFWERFSPQVLAAAKAGGKPDFFMFGEVYDGDPKVMSTYTTTGKVQATLDFGFQGAALAFAQGKQTTSLRDFYTGDDYFTDADSNAYQLPTFLGNHDMGRVAMMLAKAGYAGDELLKRDELAHSLMYVTRGQPVVYYGDEQGFIGTGGDKDAREDMFGTKVAQYAAEPLVGGGTMGTGSHYDTSAPLYTHIKGLAALRAAHPALADGAQIHRYASSGAGIYAVSRVGKDNVEYLVVANNATSAASATMSTYSPRMTFKPLYGTRTGLKSGKDTRVTVTVPPLSVSVYRAATAMAKPHSASAVYLTTPGAGSLLSGRTPITAAIPSGQFAQVSFAYRPVGTYDWTYLGTDDNAPYRVFHDVSGVAKGTLLEYRAVAKDLAGHLSASSGYGVVGDAPAAANPGSGTGNVGDVAQPDAVSVPGSHNSEMGCSGDWDPACAQAQLTLDPKDKIWKGTYTSIPAGSYEYKAAIDKSWSENYGVGGASGGGNISYTAKGGNVTFYYDHRTHYVTSDAQGPIITAAGSFQSELGCSGDWQPDCMRPWLQDPDGDGVYTWSSSAIPAGNYDFKITHGLSWDENYGAGGAKDGGNVSLSVPSDGVVVTISYNATTHAITTSTSQAGVAPDLKAAKAIWVQPGLLAWPADSVPAGADPCVLTWRLHTATEGGLGIDAESVTGGQTVDLSYDPAGLPADVVTAHPELKGYLALRAPSSVVKHAGDLLRGQVVVGLYDDLSRLLDATGVQIPYVLDSLYAKRAGERALGVTQERAGTTVRVWAPTAQQVTLLRWPASAPADASAESATRTPMTRTQDGVWSATGPKGGAGSWLGQRYLFEVKVFVPATGSVVTQQVTDPYSLTLTMDSSKSVIVDLSSAALQPAQWRTATGPKLARAVDQSIYELHIRDFSMSDPQVPAAERGSYLAFARAGAGRTHLAALAKAGLNTVHLLPSFDIATIEEDPAKQQSPQCDLASYPADSTEQQACVHVVAAKDAFNWGYDPLHYLAPEGSYTTADTRTDPTARITQFRTMVGGLHATGLRVVLDQVYNHIASSGQDPKSVLDKIVPGYYHRLDAKGAVTTSTCCSNTATEHAMMQKLMTDSLVSWAKNYKVDGFRFDLMGHHSVANMKAARAALDKLTVTKDGVDGEAITLYGEGWNFGEVADNARFLQAIQGQLGGTGIGTFNDRMRDAVRGGGPFDDDPRKQGFGTGEATDPNGAPINGDAAAQAASLAHDTDLVQLGLAGNLRGFRFTSQASGASVTGAKVDYNGAPAGYADQPDEVVNYVDAHDNETIFDALAMKLPRDTTMADRVRMNTISLATVALSQGISFWHAGSDLLRSKSLDRNSYDSGDWFNVLDFTGKDNGFGRGLPMEGDNSAKWQYMKPLLADPKLKPAPADIAAATGAAQDLLALRASTPLFRLGSAAAIEAKLSFPASGTSAAHPGVIAMRIDDTAGGTDLDPALQQVVVVFNATPKAVTQVVPGLKGASLQLSPIQRKGSDPVVKTATWSAAAGSATVPARTVAVFVQPRS